MRVKLSILLFAILTGCSIVGSEEVDRGDAPITTVHEEYEAEVSGDWITVSIPFSFTNRARDTVYVPVCKVPHPPALEKKIGGSWETVYSPVVLLCLGPPLEIAPADTYEGTLSVRAGRSDNATPAFGASRIPGIYRLKWGVYRQKSADRTVRDQLPLDLRVSHAFRITG